MKCEGSDSVRLEPQLEGQLASNGVYYKDPF